MKKHTPRLCIIILIIFSLFISSCSSKFSYREKIISSTKTQKNLSSNTLSASTQFLSFFFPTNLEVGDLLFFDIKPFLALYVHIHNITGFSNDHVIMYLGTDEKGSHVFIESNDYTSLDLNLRINGVQTTKWWVFLLYVYFQSITIGKVHATNDQKQHAIQFAMSHRGDRYQWGWSNDSKYESWHANPVITDPQNPYYEQYYYPDDPYFNQWTCAELVWAAYLHQEIELDSNPVAYPDPDFNNQTFFYVGNNDLRHSENITIVSPIWR